MDLQIIIDALEAAQRKENGAGLDPKHTVPLGTGGITWSEYQDLRKAGNFAQLRVKETALTIPTDTLYGSTGLFGLCGPDDIIGLTVQDDPLVGWLGFNPETSTEKFVKGWTYTDVTGTAAGSPSAVYGAPCDDPPVSEKGVCEFVIGDFGNYHACGEGVDVSDIGMRKCDKQPTYTIPIEGLGPIRIDNDLDLETVNGALVVKHAVSRHLINGDANTAYQFNGLEQLVKTGYVSTAGNRCTAMDSWYLDWSNDDLSGATNGYGNIIGVVREMWRNIRWRIRQTGLGMPREGDVALVMPYWLARPFLDEFAWWALKSGAQYEEVFRDNIATREFRNKYNGGLFNGGWIEIDGFKIHILEHDWSTVSQSAPYFCGDIYLLVRAIGGRRVFYGQYKPANMGADAVAAAAGYRYFNVEQIQGGRGIRWMKFDNACVRPCVQFSPRLYLETPWAQGRIANVCVSAGAFNPMSVDPQSSYFIEDNIQAASSITQYWYDDEGWFH